MVNWRRGYRLIGYSGVAILLALSTSAFPAQAGAPRVAPSPAWNTHSMPAKPAGASAAAIIAGAYPADCTARSDQPHISTHFPDRVAAQGWTICSVQRPSETVNSTLYRQDCWWIFCWWTQVGYYPNTNGYVYYGAVRAVPSYTCNGTSSHLYEIDSYHELTDFDGTIWYRYSSNQAWVNCG